MARPSSITPEQGAALLKAYQRTGNKSAAAREIGVSEDAAARYLAKTPEAAAPTIAQQRQVVEAAGTSLWDTRGALDDNYGRLLQLVAKIEAGIIEQRGEYVTMTPVATHVAALKEIRETVKTSMELAKLLMDVEQVKLFQDAVIEAIGDADPATQQRLIEALQRRRALGFITGPARPGAAGQG